MLRLLPAVSVQSAITDMQDDEDLPNALKHGVERFPKPSKPGDPEFYVDKNFSKEHFDKIKSFMREEASDNLKY